MIASALRILVMALCAFNVGWLIREWRNARREKGRTS